jgi:hypothetical protein
MIDLLIVLLAALLFVNAADCLRFCVDPAVGATLRRRLSLAVGGGLLIAIIGVGYGVVELSAPADRQSDLRAYGDNSLSVDKDQTSTVYVPQRGDPSDFVCSQETQNCFFARDGQ